MDRTFGMSHDDNCLAVTGYVGHVLGYLPTPKQILEGGYEVDGFKNILNSMVTGAHAV